MKPIRPRFASDDQRSPADRQAQAVEDVERIAQAIYRAECIAKRPVDNMIYAPFNLIGRVKQEQYRSMARQLLTSGVVLVGRRPETGEAPPSGQLALEERRPEPPRTIPFEEL